MWSILQRIFLSKDSINLSIELKGRSVKITHITKKITDVKSIVNYNQQGRREMIEVLDLMQVGKLTLQKERWDWSTTSSK